MPVDRDLAQRVLAEIDRNELGELGRALTDIPSPTGQEQALAEFILSWFAANGMKPIRREVEAGRPNAVGILKGSGGGLSLMFNGHMDTSYTGTGEDRMITARMEPESDLRGSIFDCELRRFGISNIMAGVAGFLIAVGAIQRCGVQ